MVQILPQKTNIGSNIGRTLGQGFLSGIQQHMQSQSDLKKALFQHQLEKELRSELLKQEQDFKTTENQANRDLERELFQSKYEDYLIPEAEKERQTRRDLLETELGYKIPIEQAKNQSRLDIAEKNIQSREKIAKERSASKVGKSESDIARDKERAEIIGKYFGPEAAEIYPQLTEGGKTKLTQNLLEDKARGVDTSQTLRSYAEKNPQEFQSQAPKVAGIERRPEEVGLLPKEIIKARQEEQKFKREHETKRSDKILEEAYDISKNIPIQQANIDLIKNAINEVGGFDQDFLAEVFHFEPLRTAKGTQLKSAGKDLFIKSIQGAGTRPNQWIEQQIGSALTQIGKTPEANGTVAEMAQFQLDLNKKKVEIINQLEDKYNQELGYVPGRIGREAEELLRPYAQYRQDKLAYDLRRLYEKEQSLSKVSKIEKVSQGTPLTVEMARELLKRTNGNKFEAENLAKKIGYTIPSAEIYSGQMQ
jgi:hypothetical protein